MFWRIRRFFRACSRLIAYAPVIWRNEEWDYNYLFELLAFKLGRMEHEHRNDSHHLHADRYARQLQICRTLLTRLQNDNYLKHRHAYLEARYGEHVFNEGGITRSGVTPENKAAYNAEMTRMMKYETLMQKQDLEMFCRIFKKYVFHWWT